MLIRGLDIGADSDELAATVEAIVFERGIEAYPRPDGTWSIAAVVGCPVRGGLAELMDKYDVRPVVVSPRVTYSYPPAESLCAAGDEQGLDAQMVTCQAASSKCADKHLRIDLVRVSYIAGSVCHHCRNLASIYRDLCHISAQLAPFTKELAEAVDYVFADECRPYYEFEALVTAAVRCYETMRYPLWHAFGTKNVSLPRSFSKTLDVCKDMPAGLRQEFEASWSRFGCTAKDLRDCVQHNVPLADPWPSALVEEMEGGTLGVTCRVPDNPETKSAAKFTYDRRRDALTFGWELTTAVVGLAGALAVEVQRQSAADG